MVEYRTFMMKMAIDSPSNDKEKINFDIFCDVQVMLGLVVICPQSHRLTS
jgi:hypothetical protein